MKSIITEIETAFAEIGYKTKFSLKTQSMFCELSVTFGDAGTLSEHISSVGTLNVSHHINNPEVNSLIQFERFASVRTIEASNMFAGALQFFNQTQEAEFKDKFRKATQSETIQLADDIAKKEEKLITKGYKKLSAQDAKELLAELSKAASEAKKEKNLSEVKVSAGITLIDYRGKHEGFTLDCLKKKTTRYEISYRQISKDDLIARLTGGFYKAKGQLVTL